MKSIVTRYIFLDILCTELYTDLSKILDNTRKIVSTPLVTLPFTALTFTELVFNQRHFKEIFCNYTHQSRWRSMEIPGANYFMSLCKVWLSVCRFSLNLLFVGNSTTSNDLTKKFVPCCYCNTFRHDCVSLPVVPISVPRKRLTGNRERRLINCGQSWNILRSRFLSFATVTCSQIPKYPQAPLCHSPFIMHNFS